MAGNKPTNEKAKISNPIASAREIGAAVGAWFELGELKTKDDISKIVRSIARNALNIAEFCVIFFAVGIGVSMIVSAVNEEPPKPAISDGRDPGEAERQFDEELAESLRYDRDGDMKGLDHATTDEGRMNFLEFMRIWLTAKNNKLEIANAVHIANILDFLHEESIPVSSGEAKPSHQEVYFANLEEEKPRSSKQKWFMDRGVSFFDRATETAFMAKQSYGLGVVSKEGLEQQFGTFDAVLATHDAYNHAVNGIADYQSVKLRGFAGYGLKFFEDTYDMAHQGIDMFDEEDYKVLSGEMRSKGTDGVAVALYLAATSVMNIIREEVEFTDQEAATEAGKLVYRTARWALYSDRDLAPHIRGSLEYIVENPEKILRIGL